MTQQTAVDERKLMTITVAEKGEELSINMEFHAECPVGRVFGMCRTAINAMLAVATKVGVAKGMSEDEVVAAMFPEESGNQQGIVR